MTSSRDIRIIRSNRRSIMVKVTNDAEIIVRAPYFVPRSRINAFIESKAAWIDKSIDRAISHRERFLNVSDEEVKYLKRRADKELNEKVAYFSSLMNLYPSNVRITSAKKRLGSCSARDSVCFSWRLMLYDNDVIDYVVVHELAHIKHKNHSKEFYELIAAFVPDYRKAVSKIKNS